MKQSIFSDIVVLKDLTDIEHELSEISNGEIIRYAVTEVNNDGYVVNYSYKKQKSR